jgi:uncharacterized membrane protein
LLDGQHFEVAPTSSFSIQQTAGKIHLRRGLTVSGTIQVLYGAVNDLLARLLFLNLILGCNVGVVGLQMRSADVG